MRRIDLLIGGVIVLSIVFSFVGVATYEATAGDNDYNIVWASASRDLSGQGSRVGSGTAEVNIPVNFDNLTKMDFTVRVTASGPRTQATSAQVRIEPVNASRPEAKSMSFAQGQGASTQEATFSVTVRESPNATTASGPSENATLAQLAQEQNSTLGRGNWRVIVTTTGGDAVGPVNAVAVTYQIQVTVKAHTYTATLQPLTPNVNR